MIATTDKAVNMSTNILHLFSIVEFCHKHETIKEFGKLVNKNVGKIP
jgi:hypothetical protein